MASGAGRKPAKAAAKTEDVGAFLDALDHPRKPEIQALREIILAADPSISEGIKWNAPSYRTTEWFATTHLRSKAGIAIVLHLGAKKRALPDAGLAIPDPDALLEWLADDRAMATFRDLADIDAKRAAFTALLRAWIAHV